MRTLTELVRGLDRDGIAHTVPRAGDAWMVVAPSLGARILGAGVDEENLLWTASSFSARGWSQGGNAGGARTWIAPEGGPCGFFCSTDLSRWDVPLDIDPGDFQPAPADQGWIAYRSAFTARAADGASFPLAITRSMRIEEAKNDPSAGGAATARILLRHEVQNTGEAPIDRRVGLWCIVQVPSEVPGTIIIPVREGMAQSCVRPYFTDPPAGVLRVSGDTVQLMALGGRKYKIGVHAGAAAGRISYARPSRTASRWTLVTLSFPVDPRGTYLDAPWFGPGGSGDHGDAVQAYNDTGTDDLAFSEIEAHAPSARLAPGERQSVEIEMRLACGITPSGLSW